MSKKGLIGCTIGFLMTMFLVCGVVLAEKASEKALAPEIKAPMLVCPNCKEIRLGPKKGIALAQKVHVCEDCKTDVTEYEVHTCQTCGKDVLVCPMCATMHAQAASPMCPECKTVRLPPRKGLELAKTVIICDVCKKEITEVEKYVCDKCKKEYLACPSCKKVLSK